MNCLEFFYVSQEKVFDEQQQDYARDPEYPCDYRAQPANRKLKPYKSAEEIEYKQHDKSQKRVQQQLKSPFYRS